MASWRKRLLLTSLAGLAASAAAWGGWHWWTTGRFLQSTDDAYIHGEISVISPRVAGYVRTVAVRDNQRVQAGEVLVTLDERDLAAKVATNSATLAVQQAALAGYDSRQALQRAQIGQAEAALTGAEVEQRRTRLELERVRTLAGNDWATRQRLDNAEADRARAEAGVAQAGAVLAGAREQLRVLEADRLQTLAKVHEAEAMLAASRVDLDDTVIKAPVTGVVGNRGVQVGNYVRPGTQLLSLVPLETVYVLANFKETQLAGMQPGQPVTVTVDGWPRQPLAGWIESFSPATGSRFSLLPPENATGNFTKIVQRVPVRIALPAQNPLAGLIRPGLSVTAEVDTRATPTATAAGH